MEKSSIQYLDPHAFIPLEHYTRPTHAFRTSGHVLSLEVQLRQLNNDISEHIKTYSNRQPEALSILRFARNSTRSQLRCAIRHKLGYRTRTTRLDLKCTFCQLRSKVPRRQINRFKAQYARGDAFEPTPLQVPVSYDHIPRSSIRSSIASTLSTPEIFDYADSDFELDLDS